jgi:GTPase Era involved in 16S rRNA processing
MLNNKTKGVNCLLDRILHYLPEGPKYFPDDEVSLHEMKNTPFYTLFKQTSKS